MRDGGACSQELRQYFNVAPIESLFSYARHCLEKTFDKSGLVLQDVVNEFGLRLDFDVENGLYQGRRNAVGFDGVWRVKGEPDLIVEVKTTDFVAVHLETLVEYREKLLADGKVGRAASFLIVVGREDTGALEAQVRGSRFAWDMRLISVEGLIKLVQVKHKSDDSGTLSQIRQLLRPFEYTKIDKIIDVIFTTAVSVEDQQETAELPPSRGESKGCEPHRQDRTAPELLDAKRQLAVDSFALSKKQELVRSSKALFWSPDKKLRVCCAVSKRYDNDYQPYWYAYHPKWDQFLAEGKEGFFIISCMDRDEAFALPYSWLQDHKKALNTTDRGERSYWHIPITTLDNMEPAINLSKIGKKVPLRPFGFPIR